MTDREYSPLDLLRVMIEHETEFVVIGGFAVILHGYERAAKNLDIVPEPTRENLEHLRAAFVELESTNKEAGRLDVMQWVSGIESYAALRANAVATEIPQVGGTVWFAGLDDLIEMKREAGRDQDLMDITALRMAHGLEE